MKRRNERGFTLAELVIGLMIIGLVTALAAPRFRGLIKNYKLTNAARVVWLDVHRAKMMAIKRGKTMRVDFTRTAYTIMLVETGAVVFRRDFSGDYPGITFNTTATTASVSFGSTGTANGGTVVIQGPAGSKSFTIALTGRIRQIS